MSIHGFELESAHGHAGVAQAMYQPNIKEYGNNLAMVKDSYMFASAGMLVNPCYCKPKLEASEFPYLGDHSLEGRIQAVRALGISRTILVLAPAADVAGVMNRLRSFHPSELFGNLHDYSWMCDNLCAVVASPEDKHFVNFHDITIGAILVAEANDKAFFTNKVIPLLYTFSAVFSPPGNIQKVRPRSGGLRCGHVQCVSDEVLAMLHAYLPEAVSCTGLGDLLFRSLTVNFGLKLSASFTDWSGIVALLPGIMRAVISSSSSTGGTVLVVGPDSRLVHLCELLRCFAAYMGLATSCSVACVNQQQGIHQHSARIAIGTPDKFVADTCTSLLVLVETDVLLSRLDFKQQVEALLMSGKDIQIGLHHGQTNIGVDSMISRFMPRRSSFPPAVLTLKGVHLFRAVVARDKDKLEKLWDIWYELGRQVSRLRLAVYCSSPDSVMALSDDLEGLGVPVCAVHSGMDNMQLEDTVWDYCNNTLPHAHETLLITDIYKWRSLDVVHFDLPYTVDQFLEQVGRPRTRRARLVITLAVSGQPDAQLLTDVEHNYGVAFKELPDKTKMPGLYKYSSR